MFWVGAQTPTGPVESGFYCREEGNHSHENKQRYVGGLPEEEFDRLLAIVERYTKWRAVHKSGDPGGVCQATSRGVRRGAVL